MADFQIEYPDDRDEELLQAIYDRRAREAAAAATPGGGQRVYDPAARAAHRQQPRGNVRR